MHVAEAMNAPTTTTTSEPDKIPEIEAMCGELAELRSHAVRLEEQARTVETRLLGPTPAEEDVGKVIANVHCLTGIAGSDIRAARDALHGMEHSLERIVKEMGSIGLE